jgi:hypothetical protein
MDLSFNVSGAGPLAQISAHVISIDTAIWLASGAIGWWKARERSLSLAESLSARKKSLVTTSSFNYNEYREVRKRGTIQVLALQKGILEKFKDGAESTAVTEAPGVDCLRALTTGLLCFYGVQLTTTILTDIIPYRLLQSDQEDDGFEFNGPLCASLSDWVTAVAAEEDCNNFRQHLLQAASRLCRDLVGTHAERTDDEDGYDELGLLLGCLRWMVTPVHQRNQLKYPTRSIRVWTTMAVMSKLGFSVKVYLQAVQSKEQYDATFAPQDEDDFPDVVLVTSAHGKTDPWSRMADNYLGLKIRPQVIPILSIPNAIFGRLQGRYGLIDAAGLIDVWKVCYRYAKSAVGAPTLSPAGMVKIEVKGSEYQVYRDSHKALIFIWSPHLARILRPAFEDYLPKSLHGCWSPDAIEAFLHRQSNGERTFLEEPELIRNAHTMIAILLGTVYGVCSTVLSAQVSEDCGRQSVDEALEIAISPDIIQSGRVASWVRTLGLAFGGVLDQSAWVGLILELVTGIEHPQPLEESLGLAGKRLNVVASGPFDSSRVRVSDVVGAQANGVFAISEFIARPSSNAASCLKFHIGIGRILDIPVDQSGYVRASQWKVASSELILNPEPEVELLSLEPSLDSGLTLRIDAEPHWQNDPQTICFAVRSAGRLVATLNIKQLLERLLSANVECKCEGSPREVSVSRSERWQSVSVGQILRSGIPNVPKSSVFFGDRDRIVVNVADDTHRVCAAAIISCRKMAICKDCVPCAYQRLKERTRNFGPGSVAMVIG